MKTKPDRSVKREPKPTPAPSVSLPPASLQTNRILDPIVRSVYESLALRDPAGAERYLAAHQSDAVNRSASE